MPEGKRIAAFNELSRKKTPAERLKVLDVILKELSKQAGIAIDVSESARKNWAKQPAWIPLKDVPLETMLDVIAVAAKADWQIAEEERIEIKSPQ